MTSHHDGCFGCGQANLFGLQLEDGRFFVKQDHQGAPGFAHSGILACALMDAIALAGGSILEFEIELGAPAPVGTFVHVEVSVDHQTAAAVAGDGNVVYARASARLAAA